MKTWLEYARLHLDKSDDHPLECEVKDAKEVLAEIDRLTRKRDTARMALEIIAGKRQCVDNLMSNVEIALCALEQTVEDRDDIAEGLKALNEPDGPSWSEVKTKLDEQGAQSEEMDLEDRIAEIIKREYAKDGYEDEGRSTAAAHDIMNLPMLTDGQTAPDSK